MVDNEKNIVFATVDNIETYIEVGVYQGKGIVDIAIKFPKIKKLIGVDNYLAYTDEFNNYKYITTNLSRNVPYKVTKIQSQLNKEKAIKLINEYSLTDRIELWDSSSLDAAMTIANNSIDIVFLDSYTNKNHAYRDVIAWYSKVKHGGILCGQEWTPDDTIIPTIQSALDTIESKLTIQKLNTFWYIKKEM